MQQPLTSLSVALALAAGAAPSLARAQSAPAPDNSQSSGQLAETVAVPAGDLIQGSDRGPDEPRRTVQLSAYRIDRYEVSVADFEQFMAGPAAGDQWWSPSAAEWRAAQPAGAGSELRRSGRDTDHPVVAVTWYEADAYCRWRGGSLPTEAQWERAACGPDGDRRFPWGDNEDVDAQWYDGGKYGHIKAVATSSVTPAEGAQLSPTGLAHAAGNVWEWTADWYHRDGYRSGASLDPTGPQSGTWRTLRGGSFMNLPSYCTCTHREPARPDRVALTTGFRCAYPAE